MKLFFFIFIILSACSDTPSRERFPGPQGQTTESQRAATSKAVLGGFDPLSKELKTEEGSNNSQNSVAPKNFVRVKVKLPSHVKIKPGMFLYVSARRPEGGPPLAVQRIQTELIEFPFNVELSEKNAMIRDGSAFTGKVQITARLDQDGDPLSRTPGDAFGQKDITISNQSIEITIDQIVK